ncbi:uncharacterized protein LOC116299922 isoform X2 [Actinia tenebrosa]|uniref:Uncharacterized protein LOC116299922 isoform X2 n=1 Tax=Actinia tenebrosa TaxID=6105 RepID=A0A6P8I8W0_ACTTE|nr:uncharacterized protein LOC116299922 isoform X2 [Actinia tenebrosa]
MEPQEVKVVVYAARNLQSKREDVCCASVVFGIGKEKFRTEVVKENNPTWNEESVIKLGKAAPLVFTVFDKEDVLGTVTVPLAQIPSAAHRRRWMPLTNKNAPSNGDLCLDCWVVSFRKSTATWTSAFKTSFLPSSMIKDRSKRRQSIEMASISLKGSHSQENLYTDLTLKPASDKDLKRTDSGNLTRPLPPPPLVNGDVPSIADTKQKFAFSFRPRLTPTLGQIMSGSGPPEITVVTPKCGPASGGTKITIRGANLGTSKDDILSLSINGSDVRSTMEWHSPAKLTCKTKPWGGSGPVAVVTKTGGRGTSMVKFTFQEEKAEKIKDNKVPRHQLLEELTRLRHEVHELSDEKEALQKYIDDMMVTLMEKCPETSHQPVQATGSS